MADDEAGGRADAAAADGGADGARCSARGCRSPATVDLTWRNPALHTGDRMKHWLSCAQHEDKLADFLAQRRFLLGRSAIDGAVAGQVSGRVAPK